MVFTDAANVIAPLFPAFARPAANAQALMLAFRAYSGIRVSKRDTFIAPQVLGRLASLEVRLASTAREVRFAQKLRYQIFCNEMSASPNLMGYMAKRDVDVFDSICDHLLVIDRDLPAGPDQVIGTYRLLRQEIAERHGRFYTAGEYEIGGLLAKHRQLKFLELGRSCVLPRYRDRRVAELLWHGIWAYVVRHRLDVMIGCASLEGTNVDKHTRALSFLHHFASAPDEWRVQAVPHRYIEMNRVPKNALNPKAALRDLPPLIKGYLRVGAFIGSGAVVDRQFGTTDVFVALPVSKISPRYLEHFGQGAERYAA